MGHARVVQVLCELLLLLFNATDRLPNQGEQQGSPKRPNHLRNADRHDDPNTDPVDANRAAAVCGRQICMIWLRMKANKS